MSWVSCPTLSLSVPWMLTLDSRSDVTLPLLHMIPSQPPSQGSLAEDQLKGAFVHWLWMALRAEAS